MGMFDSPPVVTLPPPVLEPAIDAMARERVLIQTSGVLRLGGAIRVCDWPPVVTTTAAPLQPFVEARTLDTVRPLENGAYQLVGDEGPTVVDSPPLLRLTSASGRDVVVQETVGLRQLGAYRLMGRIKVRDSAPVVLLSGGRDIAVKETLRIKGTGLYQLDGDEGTRVRDTVLVAKPKATRAPEAVPTVCVLTR